MPTDGTDIMYPDPWMGGESHFRDAVDYMLTATWAVLDLAADRKSSYLYNIYRMGKDAIAKSEKGGHFAYVLPKNQRDPFETTNLVNVLLQGGIEIQKATADFKIGGKKYDAGSFVIYTGQAFSPYLQDLMEKQDYPTRFLYPGGPPKTPYDLAGWTLPMQMGINVDKIEKAFEVTSEPVADLISRYDVSVEEEASFGYLISVNTNASYAVVNRILQNGGKASRVTAPFKKGKESFPAGSFVVSAELSLINELAKKYGLTFTALKGKPDVPTEEVKMPKIGLYKSWVANMDEGWTRFVLDTYMFDYDTLHDQDIRSKDLGNYDAIILPSQDASSILHGHDELEMPKEFTGGIGLEGLLALDRYAKKGGTLLAFDQASDLLIDQFGLPVKNAVKEIDSKDFFIPGSLIKAVLDSMSGQFTYGMQDTIALSFNRSRAFSINEQSKTGEGGKEKIAAAPVPDAQVLVKYASKDLLMSGWALGADQHLAKKAALLKVNHGDGQIFLYAFRPQFRAQPRGTYKLIFNVLYESAK
jgi:hypothetical protein